jgi:hypothetical protein
MDGYSQLERYLLSAPVPGLGLPALIEPIEEALWQREADLGLDRNSPAFLGELLFTLRMNRVVVLIPNLEVVFDGIRNPHS